ncbi:MAG TPA: PQQ-binding-like beta-propeller repeat protein [Ktedonobacterales bacterium]|nr:PQQ-binding-like beta-propeller repeat protein [Ktedonobacterales bacterium]
MRDDAAELRVEVFAQPSAMPAEVVLTQTTRGVTALDGATGAPLWRLSARGRVASVAHGGERVYISAATDDRPTWFEVDPPPDWQPLGGSGAHPRGAAPRVQTQPFDVMARRASDGASVWRVTLYGDRSTPPVYLAGGMLITSILSFERYVKEIIALDAATGALRWRREIGPLVGARGWSWQAPFWMEGAHVAVITQADAHTADMRAYTLLDATTGALSQHVEHAPSRDASFTRITSGGVVYQLDQTRIWPHTFVQAVRISDNVELWRVAYEGHAGRQPAPIRLLAAGGLLYLLSHSARAAHIRALDMATGRDVWRWRSPAWLYWLFLARQPLRRINEARRAGSWRPLWSDALHLRWRRPIRPAGGAAMAVAHGRVYVANYLGAFALRADDGRQLWHGLPLVEVSDISAAPSASSSPPSPVKPRPTAGATSWR